MKNKVSLILPLFVLLLGSCGGKKEGFSSDSLSVQLVPSTTFLLPGNVDNCEDKITISDDSVQEERFRISSFRLQWTSPEADLRVLRITVSSPAPQLAGPLSCIISGDEMDLMLGTVEGYVPAATQPCELDSTKVCETRISDNLETKTDNPRVECGLNCGGISTKDEFKNVRFSITADVEVLGVAINDETQEESVVKQSATLKLIREPF